MPTGTREKKYLSDQKNGLIVEITRCNIWLQKNYRRYRDKFGKTMGMLPGLNYRDIYEQLYKAILIVQRMAMFIMHSLMHLRKYMNTEI